MPLSEVIASVITVKEIQTGLEGATAFPPGISQYEAARVLAAGKFDNGPVMLDGKPLGHVVLKELDPRSKSPIQSRLHPLGPGTLLSADTPVGTAMHWLAEAPFLFVLDGREVTGLVTYADVNKQPGRLHFFLLLMDFELALSGTIRQHYRNQRDLYGHLSQARSRAIEERFRKDQAENVESDRLASMNLSDLLTIAGHDERIRKAFNVPTKTKWHNMTGGLNKLRNDIMHPTRQSLLANFRGLNKLISYETRLLQLIAAVPTSATMVGLYGKTRSLLLQAPP